MSDTAYPVFQHYGTNAQRLAFTPSPPSSGQPIYVWYESDTNNVYIYTTAWHLVVSSAGNVTTSATLTANKAIIGNGTTDITISAATGVAHLASGVLTGSNVLLASEVTGTLPIANGGTNVTAIPKFSVNKGGTNQTAIATGTYTKLTWSTEVFDTNNNFASSTFTPTIAGKYIITGGVTYTAGAANSSFEVVLYKNGVLLFENLFRFTGTSGQQAVGTWIVDMNGSTDTLELYAWQGTGSDKIVFGDITATYFMGSLLP